MELSFFTNCFPKGMNWEQVCSAVSSAGFKYIDVAAGGYVGKWHCHPEELLKDEDALKKFMETAERCDLKINELACMGNVLHPNVNIANGYVNDLKHAIRLAQRLRVNVYTFAGCPGASDTDQFPNWIALPYPAEFRERNEWQWEKKIVPFWKDMVKRAQDAGIKLAFKMHAGDAVYNTHTLFRLRESVGADEIGCKFDAVHIAWQGMDPVACIKRLGKTIIGCQAQECELNPDVTKVNGVLTTVGYAQVADRPWNFRIPGFVNTEAYWKKIVSTLRLVGYDGCIGLEHIDSFISLTEGIRKSKEFMDRVVIREKPDDIPYDL